jgi:hypothetical protein
MSVETASEERAPPFRLGAYLLYLAWQVTTKCVLGVVYLAVIAEGLRIVIPPLSQKLHKLPGLAILDRFETTYQVDLANIFAVFLLLAVWALWDRCLRIWLDVPAHCHPSWNPERYRQFIVVMGSIVLFSDAMLFYFAMGTMSWGGSQFSLGALLATAAYLAVIIFASFVGVSLHQRISDAMEDYP